MVNALVDNLIRCADRPRLQFAELTLSEFLLHDDDQLDPKLRKVGQRELEETFHDVGFFTKKEDRRWDDDGADRRAYPGHLAARGEWDNRRGGLPRSRNHRADLLPVKA